MAELPLPGNVLYKTEMEHPGNFGYTLGSIPHISLMSIIDICYTACHISTQTMAPTLTVFQCIKRCIQYLVSHTHKPISYPSNSYDGSNVIRLAWSGH